MEQVARCRQQGKIEEFVNKERDTDLNVTVIASNGQSTKKVMVSKRSSPTNGGTLPLW